MKRTVFLVCVLALLLPACSLEEQVPDPPSHGIYQLTFQTECISNNHVGNDWSFAYFYDGRSIQSGHKIIYSLEQFIFLPIEVEIREKDKIDDVGTGLLQVAICDGGSGKTQVIITETSGRHKGNTAVWEITCEVTLVDKQ